MQAHVVKLGTCRFELLRDGQDGFAGIGRVWIDDRLVRSGRLPWRVYSQSFSGHELFELRLRDVQSSEQELRLKLIARFRPLPIKLLRDHSFDPIHDLGDWDRDTVSAESELDLVLRPAQQTYEGCRFSGFAYHWDYRGPAMPLFYLLDLCSWELDGDIVGATAVSQSSCSTPVAHFSADTAWSTEGKLEFLVEQGDPAPVMTHNLPRWASHGSFDFQYRDEATLIGVFERVELIRSVVCRDAGKPELKCFDKHIFDQSAHFGTSPKAILLNSSAKSAVQQQNLWTWIWQEVDERARAEFDLKPEPFYPFVAQNYWVNFTADSYRQDLLPAAAGIGARQVFVDNLKKSAMTERAPLPGVFNWNMCCGHEYELSPLLGGNERVRALVRDAADMGITIESWTNNDQALSSPLNKEADKNGWYVRLEDTRQKYGGSYAAVMSVLDLSHPEARKLFVDSHVRIRQDSELSWYLFDSFYNLAFMPINYRGGVPRTIWRGTLLAIKQLQDAGVHMTIESLGPFGSPQHGVHEGFNLQNLFACIRAGLGSGYTTVPTGAPIKDPTPHSPDILYYTLAHMALRHVPLFIDKQRVDQVWGKTHRQALADYHEAYPHMHRRYLQDDGGSVVWHDPSGQNAAIFAFRALQVELSGTVRDLTAKRVLPRAASYELQPMHTYVVESGGKLPKQLEVREHAQR